VTLENLEKEFSLLLPNVLSESEKNFLRMRCTYEQK